MKSHACGTFGTAKRHRQLAMTQLFHAAEQQDLPMCDREGGEGAFELIVVFSIDQVIERGRGVSGTILLAEGSRRARVAVSIGGEVPCDAKNPRKKPAVFAVTLAESQQS